MAVDGVRVQVRALASSGAGVADLPDGRVAFVHGTVPGDEADVRVEKEKPRWATARLERLHTPGEDRVDAPCPLFGTCGGCTLQHVDYAAQLRWKSRFVTDALGRIGGVEVEPPDVVASPETFGYRNRMTFTLRRLRGGRVVAGLHHLHQPAHVVDIHDECLLPEGPIGAVWPALRRAWGPGAGRLPEGGRLRLGLRTEGEGVVLLVDGGEGPWDGGGLSDAVPGLLSVWHQPADAAEARHVSGDAGHEPRAFRQVNEEAAQALRAHVTDVAAPLIDSAGPASDPSPPAPRPVRVVDAYAGDGVFGRLLLDEHPALAVVGIEAEPHATARARGMAPEGYRVVEGRVEDHLAAHLPADLVIMNPPRTGLADTVAELLAARPPRRLVYVSCDPATLARDVKRLGGAFHLVSLRCFDMFPQTAHVETVAVLDASTEDA